MNGLELCKKIKADPEFSHIPFLLVTALPGNKDKLAGLRAGAEDYIVKPFQLQELELKLRNLYRSARQTRELYSKTIRLAPSDIHISPEQEVFLKKAIASVEKDIDDPEFCIEALGRTLGTSRMQLYRKIRAATGQTVKEFIRDLRLERACQLLKNKDLTINEVAYMSGFREISYFRKCFKKKFGKTPSSYAEEVRG
jgi:AraC-like DNA-binding protein